MSSLVNNQSSLSALSFPCRRFSVKEIRRATYNFASTNRVCEDSNFYRGSVYGNNYSGDVFISRFVYGVRPLEFKNEIMVLSALRHVNIITLVGFCDEDEKILVHEFMPNGSLYDYLYGRIKSPSLLTVEQRLKICLGVAKGLRYLHSGTDFNVVHGNIDTDNILLDESLVPKISGFRYARTRAAGPSSSQDITTNVLRGRNWYYAPPEWHEPDYKLSRKLDVYAFGVLLLEVLCERKPCNRLLVSSLPFIMKGELLKAVPEHVKKNITPACARQCEKLIINCLEFQPDMRPYMDQVFQDLELALKLQTDQDDINIEEQSSGMNKMCQSFSLVEIERATNERSNILGEGASGKVYRGKISHNGNNIDVAVKFMSTKLEGGIPAFETEKKLLSTCYHVNIISLVGYCDGKDEKILLYEFMPNGSLYDYIFSTKNDTLQLTVEQRLEICLGVAKGLSYLHSRDDYNIIHSDLKTENILLDANLVPKISDFGLSRTRVVGPSTSSQVTKDIRGTLGYTAPECFERNYKVSRKADVYAFGVVLLEVLCEKRAWERLVIWALQFISKGELPKFTPEHVAKNISPECSRAYANLIRDCLDIDPNNRPYMSHVIANLDLALTLHKMNTNGKGPKNKYQANGQQMSPLSYIEMATNNFARENYLRHNSEFYCRRDYHGKISVDVVVKCVTWNYDPIREDRTIYRYSEDEEDFERYMDILAYESDLIKNEIDSLLACDHTNIISLVGYWKEGKTMILMYELMPNGSLYDLLHIKEDSVIQLTVEQRLEICLGVAKGLSYLHSSNIIHGYLNSKSILLGHNFVPKIISFELSRKDVTPKSISRTIRHTYLGIMDGYLAPECDRFNYTSSLKADVFVFGVIFLEVLCERTADNNLVTSALPIIVKGELAKFTPEHVGRNISRECAQACENLLQGCLDDDSDKRPYMNKVVEKLELALQLQTQRGN